MNALDKFGRTPLDAAIAFKHIEITDLHRKHGGKTKKELEAAEQLNQTAPPVERSRVHAQSSA